MSVRSKISSLLGLFAAAIIAAFGKQPARPDADDLQAADFKASTQRLGVTFVERIRSVFRFRWIKRR
jgi:hypothetical protein